MMANTVATNGKAAPLVGLETTAPTPGSAPPRSDRGTTVILGLFLLAHWWSRPLPEEVSLWMDEREAEAQVHEALSSSPALLPAGGEEVLALLAEYERLFVGPGHVSCPPYESFWREDVPIDIRRSLMGPCVTQLRGLYAELGLQCATLSGELPDNIAVELEALAFALSSESTWGVARALFFEHLRKWLPRFCRAVSHEASLDFYSRLAAVTAEWIAPIEEYVSSLPDTSPSSP